MKKVLLFILSGIIVLSAAAYAVDKASGSNGETNTTTAAVPTTAAAEDIGGMGGADTEMFEGNFYTLEFANIPHLFYGDYVKDDDGYIKWLDEKRAERAAAHLEAAKNTDNWDPLAVTSEITILDYIREFSIPREEFEKMNKPSDDYQYFTDKQVDVIYSFDEVRINREFVYFTAYVTHDGKTIYPKKWFGANPIEEWKRIGVSKADMTALEKGWRYAYGDYLESSDLYQKMKSFQQQP